MHACMHAAGLLLACAGVSARHNPEFTSVELYQAYADYQVCGEGGEGAEGFGLPMGACGMGVCVGFP